MTINVRCHPISQVLQFFGRLLRSRHVGAAGFVAAGVTGAILFFVCGVAIRLFIGPIALGPLAGTLSTAIAKALPESLVMNYDQAAIEWSRSEGKINLVVLGTRILDADNQLLLQAPKAEIDLAALPLLTGSVEVQRIALEGIQLTLIRDRSGDFRLGTERTDRNLLREISKALSKSQGPTTLKSFSVRNARLVFCDAETGIRVTLPQAEIRLARKPDADLDVTIKAALEVAKRPAKIQGELILPAGAGPTTGSLQITGLDLRGLTQGYPAFAAAQTAALATDLTATFKQTAAQGLTIDFSAHAAGTFNLAGSPVQLHRFAVAGRYNSLLQTVTLRHGQIDADRVKGAFDATMHVAAAKDDIDLKIQKVSLDLPGLFAQKVDFPSGAFRGHWTTAERTLTVATFTLAAAPFTLQAAGSLGLATGKSPRIDLTGTISPMGVRDLVRYWPLGPARGARNWVDKRMPSGRIGAVAFAVHLPVDWKALPMAREALDVTFPIFDAEADYLTGLTPITHASGSAKLTGIDFAIDVATAKVGALTMAAGHFYIPDINAAEQIGKIDAQMLGAIPDVLKLIDMKPLGYPKRFGIDPQTTAGATTLDISMSLPLRHDVAFDEITLAVRAATKGFGIALGPRLRLTNGDIVFEVGNTSLHASGPIGIGGSASRVNADWTEDFRSSRKVTTQISLKGTLDDVARKGLGLPTEGYIKGPMTVSGSLFGHGGALKQGTLLLDLTPAQVSIDRIGVGKPAGFPMSARVTLAFAEHTIPSSIALRVNGPGTALTANANFDSAGDLVALQVPVFRFAPKDDFSLEYRRTAIQTEVFVRGRSLDGAKLFQVGNTATVSGNVAGSGKSSATDRPLRVTAKFDRIALKDSVAISDLDLETTMVGERIAAFRLTAGLSKKATLQGSLTPNEIGRDLHLTADDAGLLLKGLFGFVSMREGMLDLKAFLPGSAYDASTKDKNAPVAKGTLIFKKFHIVDQPFLTRLFTAGSLGGLLNLMQGQGIAVETFEIPYSLRNGVISLNNARATGPAIGITAEGYIDPPQNTLAIKGTLVPLFGINSVLGNIPLLGDVLTSKSGEGIFGMSYAVKGNTDEPSIDINPLSVLAPGIFRRLFEGRIPNAMQAPSNNPPSQKQP